ncbi:hypothetical protein, partial [Georgenia sp. MJ170]|uniref:hypothetical protein n=1 Tax=Georgenia sunbinii TaxID=3117728 RepID=UPI002F264A51
GNLWHSLPARFGRLINGATADEQALRWEVSQIDRELQRLQNVQDATLGTRDADLLCEEIAARCTRMLGGYRWNPDTETAEYGSPGGLTLRLQAAIEDDSIMLNIEWAATGVEDRTKLGKYIPERTNRAAARLRQGGWPGVQSSTEQKSMRLTAALTTTADADIDQLAKGLNDALEALSFSN